VRLTDLVNQIQRRVSEGTNIIRHPFQAAYRQGRRRFQRAYENTSLPGGGANKTATKAKGTDGKTMSSRGPAKTTTLTPPRTLFSPPEPASDKRAFLAAANGQVSRLGTEVELATPDLTPADELPDDPIATVLPPLQLGESLQGGWWGRYTVGDCIQKEAWMRLYEGISVNGNEAVWIYEYLLPEASFNQAEAAQRQATFRQLINHNLRLGNGSDFRLIKLKDVIVDATSQRRCYLITRPIEAGMPLADYLQPQRAMPTVQVRQLLYQVLQSLQYLHSTYRVRWVQDRSDRGVVHGNLNLDSLWIRWDREPVNAQGHPFFVYLTRFALWEHLFWPPGGTYPLSTIASSPYDLGTITQDLADVGAIAFTLLTGDTDNPETSLARTPQNPLDWPQTEPVQALKPFILRLLGLGPEGRFNSADTALVALQTLPQRAPLPPVESQTTETTIERPVTPLSTWMWLLGILGCLGLGLIGIWLWRRGSPLPAVVRCDQPCRLQDAVPDNLFRLTYAIEPESAWATAFHYFVDNDIPGNRPRTATPPLEQVLSQRSSLRLLRPPLPANTSDLVDLVAGRRRIQAALLQDPALAPTAPVTKTAVAHDGIVFFVAFSDAYRDRNVPRQLNGSISLEQVGRLFRGETTTLKDQRVQLFFPQGNDGADSPTVPEFRQQLRNAGLLTDETEPQFNQLWQQDRILARQSAADGGRVNVYERMLDAFEAGTTEDPVIGIGFDRLSRVYGQCSVYPLALQVNGRTYAPLVQANDQPITPITDLCGDKGSYWPNAGMFDDGNYPFGYELAVVYPNCESAPADCEAGQVFAEMMTTPEGQYLLSQVGLTPLQPITSLRRMVWAGGYE